MSRPGLPGWPFLEARNATRNLPHLRLRPWRAGHERVALPYSAFGLRHLNWRQWRTIVAPSLAGVSRGVVKDRGSIASGNASLR